MKYDEDKEGFWDMNFVESYSGYTYADRDLFDELGTTNPLTLERIMKGSLELTQGYVSLNDLPKDMFVFKGSQIYELNLTIPEYGGVGMMGTVTYTGSTATFHVLCVYHKEDGRTPKKSLNLAKLRYKQFKFANGPRT